MSALLRSGILVAVLLGAAGSATPAAAQPADEAEVSPQQQFAQARELFHAGDFQGALALFEKVYEATRSPNAHLFLARCHREVGNLVQAYSHMRETMSEASAKAGEEERYADTRNSAARELAEITAQVGLLSVLLTDQPAGTEVTVLGEPIASEDLGSPIPVEPGTIEIVATAPGLDPVKRKVKLRAGESKTVAISLSPQAREAGAEPATPVERDQPEAATGESPPSTALRTAGFITAGVGVAGMVTFAIAGSVASSKFGELEDECGDSRCAASLQDTVDSGRSMQTVANVGLIVGAVGLVAGGTMIVLGWPSQERAEARRLPASGLLFDVGPARGSVRYTASF